MNAKKIVSHPSANAESSSFPDFPRSSNTLPKITGSFYRTTLVVFVMALLAGFFPAVYASTQSQPLTSSGSRLPGTGPNFPESGTGTPTDNRNAAGKSKPTKKRKRTKKTKHGRQKSGAKGSNRKSHSASQAKHNNKGLITKTGTRTSGSIQEVARPTYLPFVDLGFRNIQNVFTKLDLNLGEAGPFINKLLGQVKVALSSGNKSFEVMRLTSVGTVTGTVDYHYIKITLIGGQLRFNVVESHTQTALDAIMSRVEETNEETEPKVDYDSDNFVVEKHKSETNLPKQQLFVEPSATVPNVTEIEASDGGELTLEDSTSVPPGEPEWKDDTTVVPTVINSVSVKEQTQDLGRSPEKQVVRNTLDCKDFEEGDFDVTLEEMIAPLKW